MATAHDLTKRRRRQLQFPPLEPGDHLDQPTFHVRYEQMPEDVKAELVGGVVYMQAAMRMPHGRHHGLLMMWLTEYMAATPGVDCADNATVILDDLNEPQPDACLLVIGGQTRENEDGYLAGPPELVAEVASSSEAYDLHSKRIEYERCGVQEYLVFVLREERVVWFVRRDDRFVELSPGDDGILRSTQFPGLWLDSAAFFRRDARRVQEVLSEGLNSPEHATFVDKLGKRQE